MFNLIIWIVLGAIAGWIASMMVGNNASQGWVGNIVVGIIGALIGGWIAQALGGAEVTGLNLYSIIVSVIGAVILLVVMRMVRGGKAAV